MSYTIWWLSDKEIYLPMQDTQETQVQFNLWVRKVPWRIKWQPTAVFLPGKSHGQRSLVGYSPWGQKELETTQRLSTICKELNNQDIEIHVVIGPGQTLKAQKN